MRIDLRPALILFAAAAAQAETSPWYVGVSQAVAYNSNLLGLADGQAAPTGFSRNDTTYATSLLAGLDQPFGRQRAYGSLTLRANRMAHNEIYDNEGYALNTGLDWSSAERLSGSLLLQANRNLAGFNADEIGFVAKKNLETTRQFDTSLRLGVVTQWTAELNAGTRSVDYSADEFQSREFRQDSASLGLRWRPSEALGLGLAWRETRGRYPRFRVAADGSAQPDHFARRDLDLSSDVEASGASKLSARFSFGRTEYDVATQRDFSGVTGLLRWQWQASGHLRFDTQLSRDPSQSSYFFQSPLPDSTVDYSRLTTALRLRSDYSVSGKLAFNTTLSHERRSLARTLPSFTGSEPLTGLERVTRYAVGTTWTPSFGLLFGCDVSRERRHGDDVLSSNATSSGASCYGQLLLQ